MDDPLETRVRRRLAEWEAGGLLRVLRPPSGVDLSSNDYLNLSAHPQILDRFSAAIARLGCGSTGSRLLRGDRDVFDAIERRFAAFKGAERALYFSSGYLANIATLTTLTEPGDVVFSDDRNHASLIDGMRLSRAMRVVFAHNDVHRLADLLAKAPPAGHRFVVVESVFSMDGDSAPLAAYAELCGKHRATLIVDEAHAVGVFGRTGSGLLEMAGVGRGNVLSINTAGKALGVSGAFVAGPSWAIEYLVQRARPFVFSTAPPPAVAEALDASLDIVQSAPERRQRVMANAGRLRGLLRSAGIDVAAEGSQIIPVMIGDNASAVATASALQAEGFDVRAIRPPSVPPGTARLRLSVNAGLGDDVLCGFAKSLGRVLKEVGLCSAGSS